MKKVSSLAGSVAIVTGAAQGIGAAVAEALAAQGVSVCLLDVDDAVLPLAARLSVEYGRPMLGKRVDVGDADQVEQAAAACETVLGPVSVLVNVAGILRMAPVLEMAASDWAASFRVNVDGVMYMSGSVARRMVTRGKGSIVTVGSNAATVPRTHMAAYAASKAAALQYMRCLGLELAGRGVRCNVVSPGSTDTAMQQQLWQQPGGRERVLQGALEDHRLGIPLGRIACPEDVAAAVCFLASDEARHITLHDLRVDGGATLDA